MKYLVTFYIQDSESFVPVSEEFDHEKILNSGTVDELYIKAYDISIMRAKKHNGVGMVAAQNITVWRRNIFERWITVEENTEC